MQKWILLIYLPLILLIGLLSAIGLSIYWRGNPLFKQKRIGQGQQCFVLYKFRTLTKGQSQKAPRGLNLIRHLGLDEIPQILNILRGEMKLIGPRPLLPRYLPYFSVLQQKRHQVKPGLIGLAQVKGRNQLSWQHKLRYDRFYVEHHSLKLDLYILYLSLGLPFKSFCESIIPPSFSPPKTIT